VAAASSEKCSVKSGRKIAISDRSVESNFDLDTQGGGLLPAEGAQNFKNRVLSVLPRQDAAYC
jgi:hypothetical protein